MHSASFRRIARVFALLLLVWTAADVCDYGLCAHHRDPLGSYALAALRPDDCRAEPEVALVDDCFCCSRLVDVRTPFQMTLEYDVAWVVADNSTGEPHLTSVPLYHPPLA